MRLHWLCCAGFRTATESFKAFSRFLLTAWLLALT